MNPGTEPLLSVLLADVPGCMRLHERLGGEEARRAIERCLNRAGRCVSAFGGRIVITQSHELAAVFDSAANALQAAIEMQQRITDLPPISGLKLEIRIGFSHGPTRVSETSLAGEAANVAAWLASQASPGQILTSAQTVNLLSPPLRALMKDVGPASQGGKLTGTRLFEYSTTPAETTTPPSTADIPTVSLLILRHAGNEITLDDSQGPFSLGRENVCGLVATGHKVSRLHAAIEFKGNRFLLIDRSTNGTFVKFGKEPEIRLHRQELALRGKGLIGLAGSTYDPNVDVVAFELTTAS